MPEKQTVLNECLVSHDIFVIFTSVEQMEMSCEAKNESPVMFTL